LCRLRGILVDAFDTFYASLGEHTLGDLVEKPRALTQALIRRRAHIGRSFAAATGEFDEYLRRDQRLAHTLNPHRE
jgi:hypothetical protein